MTTPTVTIGMPVYNGEMHIAAALEAWLGQSYSDFRLLVSDNASTDSTMDIVKGFARRDSRISVIRQPMPTPAIDNFNFLLHQATSPYFVWAAHDDLWEPTFIECLLPGLEQDPSAELSFCSFDSVDLHTAERLRLLPSNTRLGAQPPVDRLRTYLLMEESDGKANLIYGLVRTSTLQAASGLRRWGVGEWGCDMLSVFRLLSFGHAVTCADVLFHKRMGPPAKASRPIPDNVARHGYFSGYARLINIAPGLTPRERSSLHLALSRKVLRYQRTSLRGYGIRSKLGLDVSGRHQRTARPPR